jgi:uncharacterized protein YeeX (DUF496 family)
MDEKFYNHEINRVEDRLQNQIDRRFNDTDKKIENIEQKVDNLIKQLNDRQYEKHEWTIREIITVIVSFVLGGGLLGALQIFIEVSKR